MKKIIGLFLALFVYAGIAFAAVNINSATKASMARVLEMASRITNGWV